MTEDSNSIIEQGKDTKNPYTADGCLVTVEDGKMFTTSLIVAEVFEKNHFDVLKPIKNLECSRHHPTTEAVARMDGDRLRRRVFC